jgi:hypothetical protein
MIPVSFGFPQNIPLRPRTAKKKLRLARKMLCSGGIVLNWEDVEGFSIKTGIAGFGGERIAFEAAGVHECEMVRRFDEISV